MTEESGDATQRIQADVSTVKLDPAPSTEEPKLHHPPQSLVSFREESNLIADLDDLQKKALAQLQHLVQQALDSNQLTPHKGGGGDEDDTSGADVCIWGVPLMKDDRSDVILLKFLRARDFKAADAFEMLKTTLRWRREYGVDQLLEEDLGHDLDKVAFMHGYDRDGHPVCYNVYGEFQNKELYNRTFLDQDKQDKFIKWRIQFLERSIRKLDFRQGGISSVFQVNDFSNMPGLSKRHHWLATKQAIQIMQDNYPEFVAKQVLINLPWWYVAYYTMLSPFMTQRMKSKLVFAGPAKSADTLFKYISPEHVPVQYGGLSVDYCDCNPEFTLDDPVSDVNVKPGTKQTVEIIIYEKCTIVWELRVPGWEVRYAAEFVPDTNDAYTIIVHKSRKMLPADEPVVCESFKVTDLGKLLLIIDNPTQKKKKLLYRYKINPSNP
uniref:Patellin-3 n=1 Tax=Kalanchoe fedtschenkoi TaxID=63787 RepID=A0A7N0UGQ6_KALFE